MYALDVGPGDEVIVPPMTFAASANCVLYQGATPVFADVDPTTLLIDPQQVEANIGPRTKAIIAVDYAGQPCDYDALRTIADQHGLALVSDACHSIGGKYKGAPVGSLADLSVFSLHPVKHITSGEGGMITTDDARLAQRMRMFLYVIRLDSEQLSVDRAQVFAALRAEGIGVNVHYIPVHLHPYYRTRLNTGPGLCPVAEAAYEEIVSLPLFPQMTAADEEDVIEAVSRVVGAYAA
jgi:dTDP-4-amino-4,6-dideoxygalactose transaminase